MAIVRDEVCANRVGLLAEMGAMEEELLVFGCCYLENGQVKYRVSSDKDEISLFQLDAVDAMVFPNIRQVKFFPHAGIELAAADSFRGTRRCAVRDKEKSWRKVCSGCIRINILRY